MEEDLGEPEKEKEKEKANSKLSRLHISKNGKVKIAGFGRFGSREFSEFNESDD